MRWYSLVVLLIVAQAFGCSEGVLILEQNVEGLGQRNEIVLDQIVPFHLSFGLQQLDLTRNQTVMAMSTTHFEKICGLFNKGNIAQVKQEFNGAQVLLYSGDLSCAAYGQLGMEQDREYQKLWCEVAPIVIDVQGFWFPGIFPNFRVQKDEDFMEWVHQGNPCYWLASSKNEKMKSLLETSEDSLWFKGTLATDPNEMDAVMNSLPTQLYLRVLIPLLYCWSTAEALKGIRVRMKEKKATFSYMSILVTNACQSLFLAIGKAIGLHFSSSIMPAYMTLACITNLFGFSVATDVIFASILTTVRRGMHSRNVTPKDSFITLGFAGSLAILDICSVIYYMATQNKMSLMIMGNAMPGLLTLVGLITTAYSYRQVRIIIRLLRKIDPGPQGKENATAMRQLLLARIYIYWTRVIILSVALSFTALVFTALGIWTSSPVAFLFVLALLDSGKILNMISQTKCCSLPSAKDARRATARQSGNQTAASSKIMSTMLKSFTTTSSSSIQPA